MRARPEAQRMGAAKKGTKEMAATRLAVRRLLWRNRGEHERRRVGREGSAPFLSPSYIYSLLASVHAAMSQQGIHFGFAAAKRLE